VVINPMLCAAVMILWLVALPGFLVSPELLISCPLLYQQLLIYLFWLL